LLKCLQQSLISRGLEKVSPVESLEPIRDFARLAGDWQLSANSIEDVEEEIE
jgi:hypothetical protein